MFEVYCITSTSGKRYVGFTSRGTDWRWGKHVRRAEKGSVFPLHNAIRKYGAESFTRSLLERMTTEAGAKRAEQLWIKELGTFGPGGYNATLGGEGTLGRTPSVEARARLSRFARLKPRSPEWRAKIGAANRLRPPPSPETIAKQSEAKRGKKLSPEHRAKIAEAGRNISDETRAKLSKAQLGRKRTPETCAKIAEANRGKVFSPETRAKMSVSRRRRIGEKRSPEACARMSAAQQRSWAKRKQKLKD